MSLGARSQELGWSRESWKFAWSKGAREEGRRDSKGKNWERKQRRDNEQRKMV